MIHLDNDSKQTYRPLNFLGLISCIGALFFAVTYLQQQLGLDPCPLCMASRLVVIALGVIFLLAWLHNPQQLGQRGYAVLGIPLSLSGIGLNLRHIWLQSLPPEQVPECGPGLEYLVENFPLKEVLSTILQGSGECAEVQWSFFGLSLPQQTLLLFVMLFFIQLIQFRKKRRNSFFS